MNSLAIILVWLLPLQGGSTRISGEAILNNVALALAAVRDYTVMLEITADLEQVRVPKAHATMYFKQPDQIHFDTPDFALLPREAFGLSPRRILQLCTVEEVIRDTLNGEPIFRVVLRSKADGGRFRELQICVNPSRWTIDRAYLGLPGERKVTAQFVYSRVADAWLPAVLTITFSRSSLETVETSPLESPANAPFRSGIPRKGTVEIRYSDYRVNTGLPDDLFTPAVPSSNR